MKKSVGKEIPGVTQSPVPGANLVPTEGVEQSFDDMSHLLPEAARGEGFSLRHVKDGTGGGSIHFHGPKGQWLARVVYQGIGSGKPDWTFHVGDQVTKQPKVRTPVVNHLSRALREVFVARPQPFKGLLDEANQQLGKAEGRKGGGSWQGRHIVDPEHVHQLETEAALLEFRDRKPRHVAEEEAHKNYRRAHHVDGAAHHLRGMKVAQLAGNLEEAHKHAAMYALHMQNLGHSEYREPPAEVRSKVDRPPEGGKKLYSFKSHDADGLLLKKSDPTINPGYVLKKAWPKDEQENRDNQVGFVRESPPTEDRLMEQLPVKTQHDSVNPAAKTFGPVATRDEKTWAVRRENTNRNYEEEAALPNEYGSPSVSEHDLTNLPGFSFPETLPMKSDEHTFWRRVFRGAGSIKKAWPKDERENQANASVQQVVEDSLLEHGAKRTESRYPNWSEPQGGGRHLWSHPYTDQRDEAHLNRHALINQAIESGRFTPKSDHDLGEELGAEDPSLRDRVHFIGSESSVRQPTPMGSGLPVYNPAWRDVEGRIGPHTQVYTDSPERGEYQDVRDGFTIDAVDRRHNAAHARAQGILAAPPQPESEGVPSPDREAWAKVSKRLFGGKKMKKAWPRDEQENRANAAGFSGSPEHQVMEDQLLDQGAKALPPGSAETLPIGPMLDKRGNPVKNSKRLSRRVSDASVQVGTLLTPEQVADMQATSNFPIVDPAKDIKFQQRLMSVPQGVQSGFQEGYQPEHEAPKLWGVGTPDNEYDYTHFLPPEMVESGHRLFVRGDLRSADGFTSGRLVGPGQKVSAGWTYPHMETEISSPSTSAIDPHLARALRNHRRWMNANKPRVNDQRFWQMLGRSVGLNKSGDGGTGVVPPPKPPALSDTRISPTQIRMQAPGAPATGAVRGLPRITPQQPQPGGLVPPPGRTPMVSSKPHPLDLGPGMGDPRQISAPEIAPVTHQEVASKNPNLWSLFRKTALRESVVKKAWPKDEQENQANAASHQVMEDAILEGGGEKINHGTKATHFDGNNRIPDENWPAYEQALESNAARQHELGEDDPVPLYETEGGTLFRRPDLANPESSASVFNFDPERDPPREKRFWQRLSALAGLPIKKSFQPPGPPAAPKQQAQPQLHQDVNSFMTGLKALPKEGPERGKFITSHLSHPPFVAALQQHPQGKQLHQQLLTFANSRANAGFRPGQTQAVAKSLSQLLGHWVALSKADNGKVLAFPDRKGQVQAERRRQVEDTFQSALETMSEDPGFKELAAQRRREATEAELKAGPAKFRPGDRVVHATNPQGYPWVGVIGPHTPPDDEEEEPHRLGPSYRENDIDGPGHYFNVKWWNPQAGQYHHDWLHQDNLAPAPRPGLKKGWPKDERENQANKQTFFSPAVQSPDELTVANDTLQEAGVNSVAEINPQKLKVDLRTLRDKTIETGQAFAQNQDAADANLRQNYLTERADEDLDEEGNTPVDDMRWFSPPVPVKRENLFWQRIGRAAGIQKSRLEKGWPRSEKENQANAAANQVAQDSLMQAGMNRQEFDHEQALAIPPTPMAQRARNAQAWSSGTRSTAFRAGIDSELSGGQGLGPADVETVDRLHALQRNPTPVPDLDEAGGAAYVAHADNAEGQALNANIEADQRQRWPVDMVHEPAPSNNWEAKPVHWPANAESPSGRARDVQFWRMLSRHVGLEKKSRQ